jgi:hypothetical protein
VEGRLLLALKISDQVNEDEPEAAFLYTSTIHGDEPVGMVLLLRLAATLLEGYGSDNEVTGLVDGLSIWINPLSNPDGTYSADQGLSMTGAQRFNAEGTDLNRNFPQPGYNVATDSAGRALETRAMMAFLQEHRFILSANLHGGTEVVNYPWDHIYALHADDEWFRFVSREYADEARAVDPTYMALFTDGITNGAQWYPVKGGRQDYVSYYLEGREVTLELSNEKLPGADLLEELWGKNHRSLINYMSQCTYGIRGTVLEAEGGAPLRAQITILDHDTAYSVVHSSGEHGDFYRPIKEGTYNLVASAPGYLNDTVWGVAVTDYQAITLEISLWTDPRLEVEEAGSAPGFRLYPNPAGTSAFLEPSGLEPGELELRVVGMDGKEALHLTLPYTGEPVPLNLEMLPAGFYIVQVTIGDLTISQPLVRQ